MYVDTQSLKKFRTIFKKARKSKKKSLSKVKL